jgi:multidrug efflux system outer membrane protein
VFKDPALSNLVREALTNNYDLAIAATRVLQARAVADQVNSALYPQVGYDAAATRGKNQFLGSVVAPGNGTATTTFGGLNAAWELDLWGRIRRSSEAALAQVLASEEAQRGVRLTLVADVAQAYYELLELDLSLEISKQTEEIYRGSLGIFEQRFTGGVGSKLSVVRADANLADVRSQIPNLQRAIALKENQINILLGKNPSTVPRDTTLLTSAIPPDVPAGIPSDILRRRPDVLAAEQNLVASNAIIGASIADYFPRIGLTALFGYTTDSLSSLTRKSDFAWSLGANLTGPIFQGGRIDAEVKQARAQFETARLQYLQTVQLAFHDVSNALIARQTLVGERAELERRVDQLREAVTLATDLFNNGRASYFEVLEAEQQLYPAELNAAQVRLEQFVAIVQLYRALGGGWNLDDPGWLNPGTIPAAPGTRTVPPAPAPGGA